MLLAKERASSVQNEASRLAKKISEQRISSLARIFVPFNDKMDQVILVSSAASKSKISKGI